MGSEKYNFLLQDPKNSLLEAHLIYAFIPVSIFGAFQVILSRTFFPDWEEVV